MNLHIKILFILFLAKGISFQLFFFNWKMTNFQIKKILKYNFSSPPDSYSQCLLICHNCFRICNLSYRYFFVILVFCFQLANFSDLASITWIIIINSLLILRMYLWFILFKLFQMPISTLAWSKCVNRLWRYNWARSPHQRIHHSGQHRRPIPFLHSLQYYRLELDNRLMG